MYEAFEGVKGNFSVAVNGKSMNVFTMVYGLESKDVFDITHKEPIEWRLTEINHSPTGFEWGYNGSGPSQLAWCILRECGLTKEQTQQYYMDFKKDVISQLKDSFHLTRESVMTWVKKAASDKKTK